MPPRLKKKMCILCSPTTSVMYSKLSLNEKLSKKELSKFKFNCTDGMTCSMCRRFSCRTCLAKILSRIPKQRWDHWCHLVFLFLEGEEIPTNVVGHCCELKERRPNSTLTFEDNAHETCNDDSYSGRECDGDLFFPEFRLLIKTSFTTIDMHAVAPDQSDFLVGAWHCTIPLKNAINFHVSGIRPRAFDRNGFKIIKNVRIQIPWEPGTFEYVSHCDCLTVLRLRLVD